MQHLRKNSIFLLLFGLLCSGGLKSQLDTFQVELEEMTFPDFPGLHSGAVAKHNNRWIYIGGRTNGLHGFLSPFAFPNDGKNNAAWVFDPSTKEIWSADLSNLPENLYEPLTSSNIPFHQYGNVLFLAGGYGWSNASNDFRTFPTLTAVELDCLHDNIISGGDVNGCFRQITDTTMAVCGAHLDKLGDRFYLVFGHLFDGIYSVKNPNGSVHRQVYSNEVRSFDITYNDAEFFISNYSALRDTVNHHRRDYNLVPQIFPDGSHGLTAFSGVFQYGAVLPYLNTVDIGPSSATVVDGFEQHLSQYHNAVMPVYDSVNNAMHTVFFGGMSRFRIDAESGEMLDDTLVPFVKTISRVTRFADGSMSEEQLPIEMPDLLGSNMDFIPAFDVPVLHHEIIHLNQLGNERRLAGWLIGGIWSPEPNISTTSPASSAANTRVFEVYINRGSADTGIVTQSLKATPPIAGFSVSPNPMKSQSEFTLRAAEAGMLELSVYDRRGAFVRTLFRGQVQPGELRVPFAANDLAAGVYIARARLNGSTKSLSVIVNP